MTRVATLLVYAALAAALVGCGGDDTIETGAPASGGQGTPPVRPDRPDPRPDGPDEPPDAGSPVAAFQACQQMAKRNDHDGLYDRLSKRTQADLGKVAEARRAQILILAQRAPMEVDAELRSEHGTSLDELKAATTRELSVGLLRVLLEEDPGALDAKVIGQPVIEGDRATLTIRKPDGASDVVDLVKEGAWKLDLRES